MFQIFPVYPVKCFLCINAMTHGRLITINQLVVTVFAVEIMFRVCLILFDAFLPGMKPVWSDLIILLMCIWFLLAIIELNISRHYRADWLVCMRHTMWGLFFLYILQIWLLLTMFSEDLFCLRHNRKLFATVVWFLPGNIYRIPQGTHLSPVIYCF